MSEFKFQEKESDDIVYFDYQLSTGNVIKFGMRFVNDNLNRKFIRDAAPKKLRKGNLMRIDFLKYRQSLVNHALMDIKDATYADMNFLTEPGWKVILPQGKTWNDVVPFDENVKKYIANGMHSDLGEFFEEACLEYELFKQKQMAAEMKNLPDGSNSSQHTESTETN